MGAFAAWCPGRVAPVAASGRPRLALGRLALAVPAMAGVAACDASSGGSAATAPRLALASVTPATWLPGTRLRISGAGIVPAAVASYTARLTGRVAGTAVDVTVAARPADAETLVADMDAAVFAALAAAGGRLLGRVDVRRNIDGAVVYSGIGVDVSLVHLPGWIMDAGMYRPFAERAELDGAGPGVFSPFNQAYLAGILPLDPQE